MKPDYIAAIILMSTGIKLRQDRLKFLDEVQGRDETCVGQAYQRNTPSKIFTL